MAVSMKDIDSAFQGAGQKAHRGLEIWRIESSRPVSFPQSSHGKFSTKESYIILKTTAAKGGTLRHDIHYWLGKDTSQDEAATASSKAVELDAAVGGRAVQYQEVQCHETEKFLSYFKPCIIPQESGVSSGSKHNEYQIRLYACRGKHVVHVKEVPFARSSLSHEDIFILDTQNKIFQFNGSNTSIQERAKALEVAQYIKDAYHRGKCDIAYVEDGRLMAGAEAGEFWGLFGGFAPLPRKTANDEKKVVDAHQPKLFCVEKGQREPMEAECLTRELLDTSKCYILDSGPEVHVWMGRNTSLDERKSAGGAAEDLLRSLDQPTSHVIRVMEGFETVSFKSLFNSWPGNAKATVREEGRGKVAALLRKQGVNVKGLVKEEPATEEPEPYIDCTGNLQVWRVNGSEKTSLPESDLSKFYSGDCYIFLYTYTGDDKEEYLVGIWFGKHSIEEERASALTIAGKMVESMKFLPAEARIHEGNEPFQFFAIFQSFITFKGGLGEGYKKSIAEKEVPDDTYTEDGLALFRVQGSGPDNMQSIQVEPVPTSLNSAYCYILHQGSTIFTWTGNLTSPDNQELMERQLDIIKPNLQTRPQKEGSESEQFWDLLGGKKEYSHEKISRESESDPHLFSCTFLKGELQVKEVFNFNQGDLMTEDVYILDCHSDIFVWVGEQVDTKTKLKALDIGETFLERDFFMEKILRETPIYVVMEGSEPPFFTRFFTWDSSKALMDGNSFQRKLSLVKNEGTPVVNKTKRRTPLSFGGRSSLAPGEKPQRSRSVSFSPERPRARGRSPAFNALAAKFDNSNGRNLSTPPPMVSKLYPKSGSSDSLKSAGSKVSSISALSASFEKTTKERLFPRTVKVTPSMTSQSDKNDQEKESVSNRVSLTIEEDSKEGETEDDDGLPTYPYERLTTNSADPVPDIDVTKRETYLSSTEFKEKFATTKSEFYKLPKWKQNKLKQELHLF